MRSYELMVIFTPVLSQEELKSESRKLSEFIKEQSGEIVAEEDWGLRQLAYPIEKKTTALYYLTEFKIETQHLTKFNTMMNRSESILRHMTTVLDKHSIAYNARRRAGGGKKREETKTANPENTEA